MSEEQLNLEQEIEKAVSDEGLDDGDSVEALSDEVDEEIIARARANGWRDKDEYNKEPENWVDAKTFLDKADNSMPILRERIRSQEREIIETREAMMQMKELMASMSKKTEVLYETNTKKSRAELEAKLKEAEDEYDFDTYKAITAELAEFDKISTSHKNNEQPKQPEASPYLKGWVTAPENSWFRNNTEMREFAIAYDTSIRKNNPAISDKEALEKVEAVVKKAFPHEFRTSPPAYNTVEGGEGAPKSNNRYTQLPENERRIMDAFIKKLWGNKRDKDTLKEIDKYKQECVEAYYGK